MDPMDPATPEGATSPAERDRLLTENRRRASEVPAGRYAPWQPAEMLMRSERQRLAAGMLRRAGAFPEAETPCLEVGYGTLGWLGDLITWGVAERRLHGIELDGERARHARASLPAADLRLGDAARLPWAESTFGLVVVSTVFTSVLDSGTRRRMAGEIARVLRPRGAMLWYDFRLDNPRNPHVRGIGRRELRALFPDLEGEVRSLTLAPPLARLVAPLCYPVAVLLSSVPFLRTHLLAALTR